MADSDTDGPIQVELVAADRVVWSGGAREVLAKTVEGEIGILRDHAPVLSSLAPGVVEIVTESERVVAATEEGFLSVADNRVSILSEDAFLADEIDADAARSEVERLQGEGEGDSIELQRAEAKVRAAEKSS